MKILIPVIASAFIATLTFAQEESASPAAEATAAPAEEKASATVEESPAAKPAESAAPAAETKAEAAASPKAAASATEKKEATAAAPSTATSATTATTAKAAPAAAAPMNTKGMGPKELENAWEAAVASHNVATIEGMVAADFVGVSSKGKFVNRSQLVSDSKADKDTYKSAKNEKLNVKMFGPNVAVVTGRVREVGSDKAGKAFDRTFLFTDTWMMRGGKWQCIASQLSKIKG